MRFSLRSTKVYAKGMNRATAVLLLVILGFIEALLAGFAVIYGFKALGLPMSIFFMWNLSACIALITHIVSKGANQDSSYMEVSNYLNLNKIAKDK